MSDKILIIRAEGEAKNILSLLDVIDRHCAIDDRWYEIDWTYSLVDADEYYRNFDQKGESD